MRKLPSAVLSVAVLAAALGSPFSAAAQTQGPKRPPTLRVNLQSDRLPHDDFLVSPTRHSLVIPAGEKRTVDVEIYNRLAKRQDVKLGTEDFSADANGAPVFFDEQFSGPYTARLWMDPETERFELDPAEKAYVRVTVSVPADAEPGDHQAAVIVTRLNSDRASGAIGITARVACLFIITVPGDVRQEAHIERFVPQRVLNWFKPISLDLTLRNSGSVHAEPLGVIEIRNIFGIVVDEIPFRDWIVLRDSVRTRTLNWNPVFALGRYTARTRLTAFNGKPLELVTRAFWVFPILPVLIFLFLIFLISFLVQYFFARFEIRKKGKNSHS